MDCANLFIAPFHQKEYRAILLEMRLPLFFCRDDLFPQASHLLSADTRLDEQGGLGQPDGGMSNRNISPADSQGSSAGLTWRLDFAPSSSWEAFLLAVQDVTGVAGISGETANIRECIYRWENGVLPMEGRAQECGTTVGQSLKVKILVVPYAHIFG